MKFRFFFFGLIASASLIFADANEKQQLPTDYGIDRYGSMHTDGYGVIAYGDFLYWTAHMDGLDLALELTPFVNTSGSNNTFTLVNHSRLIEPDFHWDPAFRVGLGYYFKWRDWDLCLEWTRFRTDTSTSRDAGVNELFPFWGRLGSVENRTLIRISGKWDFDYDTLDLLLHPGYFRYKYFAFQPEVGIRGAWIDWKYTIDQTFLDTDDQSIRIQHLPYKNDFHSVGLIGGLNTKWFMGYGLHLFTHANVSVLYGHFDLDQPSEVTGPQFTADTSSTQKFWDVRSNIHLAMGLEWERFFMNNSILLNIHVGYEFLHWFNQNQLYRSRVEVFGNNNLEFTPLIERDDLGINGLNAGIRLEF